MGFKAKNYLQQKKEKSEISENINTQVLQSYNHSNIFAKSHEKKAKLR